MPDDRDQSSSIDPLTIGELLTIKQAAELHNISYEALRKYALKGRLKAKKMGRDWFTTSAAVEDYLQSRHRGKRTDLLTKPH